MNRSPLEFNINKITITSTNNIINTVNGTQREKGDKQQERGAALPSYFLIAHRFCTLHQLPERLDEAMHILLF